MLRSTLLALLLILAGLVAQPVAAVTPATDGPPVPPGPYLTTDDLPDFRFKVRIGGDLFGSVVPGCVQETLCVSGALPDRSELFLRVIGPRPNGFLWLNLVRFTPSEIEVWAERRSTGTVRYYRLAPLPRRSDRLRGLVDKTAFPEVPGASNPASTPRRGVLASASSTLGETARFVPAEFPDYELTVRIRADDATIPSRQESHCLPETVCVSGALPGRAEVFVRIIGPRPNEFFHVNLVRFTPSRVEVDIRRLSTGETRSYTLPAIPRSSNSLDGRLDRNAFPAGGGELPPDPGPPNDATLQGIDSDGDGIRDDVQRFISLQYGDDPDTVAALRQGAKALLDALVDSDRGRNVVDEAAESNRALECLMAVEADDSRSAWARVTAQVVDTERRLLEYLAYNESLEGQVFQVRPPDQWITGCNFEPEDLRLRRKLREATEEKGGSCVGVSDTALLMVNGVWTPYQAAFHNGAVLLASLEGASFPIGSLVTVSVLYNPHEGYIADLWEAVRQRSQLAVSRFLEIMLAELPMPGFMRPLFLDLSRAADAAALASSSVLQDHLDVYREELAEGKKVVVVAHSQGNFFANQSWRQLDTTERQSVGIVSVANPDSAVEDGRDRWTTHVRDLVIGAIPGSLPPNVDGPVGNLLGHGFTTTYLYGGSPAQNRIVGHVETAVSTLPPPDAIAEDGVITVTLSWGSEPDVDLHVTEPDGTHVYWGNQRGSAGALDVDDRNGFGPEHYVVPCDSLEPGTYRVGVNYYHGERPETARVKIDAGFVTRRFSEYLREDRGPSGVDSPVPVARILVTEDGLGGYIFRVLEE